MMGELYLWIKAVHVIAVLSWMAGLLYLPRLFVYHAGVAVGSEASELFKVMERRLLKAIMVPAAVVVWSLGLTMAVAGGLFEEHWLQMKLVLVGAMTVSHWAMTQWKNDFAADRNVRPARFFRIANEVPTLLMIGIVVLVVVKPF
jgi:protoporphyrinogen IX oxidase